MIIIIRMLEEMENTLNINAQAVLDVLQTSKGHLTAAEVYEAVRGMRPHIGLATVYRILHQLTEQRLIKELGHNDECCRYDARTSRHDHAVCTVCGALFDIPMEITLPDEMLWIAAEAAGIHLETHEVRIYGQCTTCQQGSNI